MQPFGHTWVGLVKEKKRKTNGEKGVAPSDQLTNPITSDPKGLDPWDCDPIPYLLSVYFCVINKVIIIAQVIRN